jgi:hypothetical protein
MSNGIVGPNGQPIRSSGGGENALDEKAKGVITNISMGYWGSWWVVRHPLKALQYSVGVVGAAATFILLWNMIISFAVGDGFSVFRPIRSGDVSDWGTRAGETARQKTDEIRQQAVQE